MEISKIKLNNNDTYALKDSIARTLVSNKADKVSNFSYGDFVSLDSQGNLISSGNKASDFATTNALQAETTARTQADNSIQSQIDAITSQSDVVDVVGTYAELAVYDKPIYKDDIVKVLVDESRNDAIAYYRCYTPVEPPEQPIPPYTWTYIGSQGPFYTKSEIDEKIPICTSLDENKVLTVDSQGKSQWQDPQGGGISACSFYATLPASGWMQSGDYYTQTINVIGLKNSYPASPLVDVVLSGVSIDDDSDVLAAFGLLAVVTTSTNSLTAKAAGEAPGVDIPIVINVWGDTTPPIIYNVSITSNDWGGFVGFYYSVDGGSSKQITANMNITEQVSDNIKILNSVPESYIIYVDGVSIGPPDFQTIPITKDCSIYFEGHGPY